jgi:hypothetical protein
MDILSATNYFFLEKPSHKRFSFSHGILGDTLETNAIL